MSQLAEPILRVEDHRAWDAWMRAVRLHARTIAFRRAVDRALAIAAEALMGATSPSVAWSGGKDSTVLTHLVAVELGGQVKVVSEKDDLDFPGEEQYVRDLGAAWKLDLRVVRPDVSPREWMEQHASKLAGCADIHSRSAGLSKACFYKVIEEATQHHDVVMLGLRAEESGVRRISRAKNGVIYPLKSGQRRANPIADFRGIDVYAYAETRGIELLTLYRCIGFANAHTPWLIRKSWWLPGSHTAHGQAAWLRRYYPSLWEIFREIVPDAQAYA